jgi:iron complex outermembrane recepter protein
MYSRTYVGRALLISGMATLIAVLPALSVATDVSADHSAVLDEIVVTAQKREERLQDVPIPVTVLSAQTLLDNDQVRLQDYYSSVPGLLLSTDTRGTPDLSIRGVSTGTGNPTVAVTVDDVPYGSSSTYGGGLAPVPDIDPSDLARIEVLRGPQGTLYGSSSLGGLLKYVTLDPSTEALTGRVEAGTMSVYNGTEVGYNVRGAVNVPVTDTLAIRASGFVRENPGYIDNLQTGQRSVNRLDSEGGHLSALWKPSDTFSVKLSALIQDDKALGLSIANASLGNLKQAFLPGVGYDTKTQAYSATITGKLGAFDFTSLSGYNVNRVTDNLDWSSVFGFAGDFYPTANAFEDHDALNTEKVSQELRLSTSFGKTVDWLVGGFFTHENSHVYEDWYAVNSTTLQVPGNFLLGDWPSTYTEYAVFTDLTIHFTERFNVQLGARESENRQTYSETDGGNYAPLFLGQTGPLLTPEVITKDNDFTYLVTPQYKMSDDLMLYARVASGYRPGGPTPTCSAFGIPCHFDPDRTTNYEIGIKGDVFDHVLSFDASVYYIAWRDIQIQLNDVQATIYTNGGDAKSQGVELSVQSKPLTGLTLGGWVSFNDAKLTQNLPSASTAYGHAGDPLPDAARFSASVSAEQSFPIVGSVNGFVGGQTNYVGYRQGGFTSAANLPRPYTPAYAQTDLRAGVRYETWTVRLFATNVADKRGIVGVNFDMPYVDYIQPRTIGVSVVKTF